MAINILAIIALVSIVAFLYKVNPYIAGLVMTFPVITILSILLTDQSETKIFILGALSGVIPLVVMLLVYLTLYQKFLKLPALCISFAVWCIVAAAQFLLIGKNWK